MSRSALFVTPEVARIVTDQVADALPEGWIVTPIGGTELQRLDASAADTTKDVDLVVTTVVADGPAIPSADALLDALRSLAPGVHARKDQTSVKVHVPFPPSYVVVEAIRGRKGGGGYFISRRILERIVTMSRGEGRVRHPPPEALAFLKAWGAADKDKLVASGRDGRGYHAARSQKFRLEVARVRRLVGEPDTAIVSNLLSLCGAVRREAVGRILAEAGWPVGSEPRGVK